MTLTSEKTVVTTTPKPTQTDASLVTGSDIVFPWRFKGGSESRTKIEVLIPVSLLIFLTF